MNCKVERIYYYFLWLQKPFLRSYGSCLGNQTSVVSIFYLIAGWAWFSQYYLFRKPDLDLHGKSEHDGYPDKIWPWLSL